MIIFVQYTYIVLVINKTVCVVAHELKYCDLGGWVPPRGPPWLKPPNYLWSYTIYRVN